MYVIRKCIHILYEVEMDKTLFAFHNIENILLSPVHLQEPKIHFLANQTRTKKISVQIYKKKTQFCH